MAANKPPRALGWESVMRTGIHRDLTVRQVLKKDPKHLDVLRSRFGIRFIAEIDQAITKAVGK